MDFKTKDIDRIYFFSDNFPATTYFDLCCRLKTGINIFFHGFFSSPYNKFNYKAWYSGDIETFVNEMDKKITPKYHIYISK